jgi:hypothetical protein
MRMDARVTDDPAGSSSPAVSRMTSVCPMDLCIRENEPCQRTGLQADLWTGHPGDGKKYPFNPAGLNGYDGSFPVRTAH